MTSQECEQARPIPGKWAFGNWGIGRVLARATLATIGRGLRAGRLTVITPQGQAMSFEGSEEGPEAVLRLHAWRLLPRLFLGGDIAFGESYMDGEWSSPDLATLIELAAINEKAIAAARPSAPMRVVNWLRHRARRNSREGSRRNIAQHYDVGNEFYAQWLDSCMNYSSALYSRDNQTLEEAQRAKLARVAELLDLSGGENVLEIGCGWGGMAKFLAGRRGSRVTGVTLSRRQLEYARFRLESAGLSDCTEIRFEDYRDIKGSFDRIVSIEMIEAVGEENWPLYFDTLRERLVAGGTAVIQAITIAEDRFDGYRRNPDFIQRHIFPGGMLPTPAILRREIKRAGLELVSEERFGASYDRTLAEWQRRFAAACAPKPICSPQFMRMWDYYLAYCQAGFRVGATDVGLYRIAKPVGGK